MFYIYISKKVNRQCPPKQIVKKWGNLPQSKDCVSGAVAITVEYHYRPQHYLYDKLTVAETYIAYIKTIQLHIHVSRDNLFLHNIHICRNDEHYY